jgi:hypothetical protein
MGLGAGLLIAAAFPGVLDSGGFGTAVATLVAGGAGMFTTGTFGLSAWARLRQQQMDEIAERWSNSFSTPRLPD